MSRFISILLIVVLALGLYIWMSYSNLVNADENVSQNWSQVETMYHRREELAENLMLMLKNANPEAQQTLVPLATALREDHIDDTKQLYNNVEQFTQLQLHQQQLKQAIKQSLAALKQSTQLPTENNYFLLQEQLESIDDRLIVAKQNFNEAAKSFNKKIKTFPMNIIAEHFSFTPAPYFEDEYS